MSRISTGAAIGAGFQLIGRYPVAFLVWWGVYLVVAVLPMAWVAFELIGAAGSLSNLPKGATAETMTPEFMRVQTQVMRMQSLLTISSLLSGAVLTAGVYRAALGVQEKTFYFLRLGSRELWLGLVLLVLQILMAAAMFAAMIPLGILALIIGLTKIKALFWLLGLAIAGLIGAGVWAALRLSMAPVLSFSRNNFVLFESWALTRGHAASLLWVGLALAAIIMVLQWVLIAAVLLGVHLLIPLPELFQGGQAAFSRNLARLGWGFAAAIALGFSLFATLSTVLVAAAWAKMHQALAPAPVPAPA